MSTRFSVVCETDRLELRKLSIEDASWFYTLNEDPEVLKYTGDLPFANRQESQNFLRSYNEYEMHGYGRWAVVRKEDGEVLGWCGLKYHPDQAYTEVGYRFFRVFWGFGYATEAAQACLRLGWDTLGLKVIYANVHKDNSASIRVLDRLGMKALFGYASHAPEFLRYVTWHDSYRLGHLTTDEAVQVRHPVLRPGKLVETAYFEEDTHPGVFHMGIRENGQPIATATLLPKAWDEFPQRSSWQLRGMAVLPAYRGLSLGAAIVSEAEREILSKGGELIWMNAREVAVPFYEKSGYRIYGDAFDIPGIGPHYRMYKFLI